jgi:hypothetical protein
MAFGKAHYHRLLVSFLAGVLNAKESVVVNGTRVSPANCNLKKVPMNKKPPVSRFWNPKARTESIDPTRHSGADAEIHLCDGRPRKLPRRSLRNLEQDRTL